VEKANWDKLVARLQKQGHIKTPQLARAFHAIPRVRFLPFDTQKYASLDMPVQIGFAQTVLAPRMVALMSEALALQVGSKVLEVGAGSGWQASMMAEVVAPYDAPRSEWGHVYTFEVQPALAETARRNILTAGYGDRVTLVTGDGSKGYAEKAPFDRILVTASVAKVPNLLLEQLKVGGVLLVPVGLPMLFQKLLKLSKHPDGPLTEENLGGVSFAPLTTV
jgi:protein-L-isoaspartate(D-aspartate) O-methyltransferase